MMVRVDKLFSCCLLWKIMSKWAAKYSPFCSKKYVKIDYNCRLWQVNFSEIFFLRCCLLCAAERLNLAHLEGKQVKEKMRVEEGRWECEKRKIIFNPIRLRLLLQSKHHTSLERVPIINAKNTRRSHGSRSCVPHR